MRATKAVWRGSGSLHPATPAYDRGPVTPKTVTLDHVQPAMPPGGEEAAEASYRDLLGFEVLVKPPALAVRGGRWLSLPGVEVPGTRRCYMADPFGNRIELIASPGR